MSKSTEIPFTEEADSFAMFVEERDGWRQFGILDAEGATYSLTHSTGRVCAQNYRTGNVYTGGRAKGDAVLASMDIVYVGTTARAHRNDGTGHPACEQMSRNQHATPATVTPAEFATLPHCAKCFGGAK